MPKYTPKKIGIYKESTVQIALQKYAHTEALRTKAHRVIDAEGLFYRLLDITEGGRFYIGIVRERMAALLGLSIKQYDTRMAELVEAGLIVKASDGVEKDDKGTVIKTYKKIFVIAPPPIDLTKDIIKKAIADMNHTDRQKLLADAYKYHKATAPHESRRMKTQNKKDTAFTETKPKQKHIPRPPENDPNKL